MRCSKCDKTFDDKLEFCPFCDEKNQSLDTSSNEVFVDYIELIEKMEKALGDTEEIKTTKKKMRDNSEVKKQKSEMKKEKNKAENIINKLLKKNKNMAENKEEKEELTDKTEQSEQETQNEETPKAEQEEAKEDDLATKLEELNKKYLLLYSDFENFRKRKAKEQMELVMNASEGLIKELLPVIDDYERALQNMESQDNEVFAKTKEGMVLIYNKLIGTLTKKGLKPINAKGEMFDENLHEAIARIPAQNEDEKGKVIDETTKGYYLNDKVIRYSKVVVAM